MKIQVSVQKEAHLVINCPLPKCKPSLPWKREVKALNVAVLGSGSCLVVCSCLLFILLAELLLYSLETLNSNKSLPK